MKQNAVKSMSTQELITIYNNANPDKPIKKFRDRPTAELRVAEILRKQEEGDKTGDSIEENSTQEAGKATQGTQAEGKKAQAPVKKQKGQLPGPVSLYSGKRIYKIVEVNPRQEGSHGYVSFEKIRNGMTFEEYRSAGGRTKDLAWDVKKGFVELK